MGVKQDHADAVLDLLRLAPPEGDPPQVCDGRVSEDVVPPYMLAYITTTRPDGTSLTGEQDHAVSRVIVHCVGATAAAARAVADRADAALVGVTPTIVGRSCWPIREEGDAPPVDRDETSNVPVFDQIVTYRLASIPA